MCLTEEMRGLAKPLSGPCPMLLAMSSVLRNQQICPQKRHLSSSTHNTRLCIDRVARDTVSGDWQEPCLCFLGAWSVLLTQRSGRGHTERNYHSS